MGGINQDTPHGYNKEDFDYISRKKLIQWVKDLVNNPEAISFFKKRASNYNTTIVELQKMYYEQKGGCALCGDPLHFDKTSHIDHIIPKSLGGEDKIDNYQIVCARCNYAKRDMLTNDFIVMCLKVQHRHQYKLSKMEIIEILHKTYRYDDVQERMRWNEQYKIDLQNKRLEK